MPTYPFEQTPYTYYLNTIATTTAEQTHTPIEGTNLYTHDIGETTTYAGDFNLVDLNPTDFIRTEPVHTPELRLNIDFVQHKELNNRLDEFAHRIYKIINSRMKLDINEEEFCELLKE